MKLRKQRVKVFQKANGDQASKAKRSRKSNSQPLQDNVKSPVSDDEDLAVEESQTTFTVGKVAAKIVFDVTEHVRTVAKHVCSSGKRTSHPLLSVLLKMDQLLNRNQFDAFCSRQENLKVLNPLYEFQYETDEYDAYVAVHQTMVDISTKLAVLNEIRSADKKNDVPLRISGPQGELLFPNSMSFKLVKKMYSYVIIKAAKLTGLLRHDHTYARMEGAIRLLNDFKLKGFVAEVHQMYRREGKQATIDSER